MFDLLEVIPDLLRHRADLCDDLSDGLIDTALEIHRVRSCGDILQTHTDDRLGEDSRRGGTIPGIVIGLGGHLLDELSTHVLEGIF